MTKQILGFKKSELEAAALLVVVHEDGSYDYVSTRTLAEVTRAVENILAILKAQQERVGGF